MRKCNSHFPKYVVELHQMVHRRKKSLVRREGEVCDCHSFSFLLHSLLLFFFVQERLEIVRQKEREVEEERERREKELEVRRRMEEEREQREKEEMAMKQLEEEQRLQKEREEKYGQVHAILFPLSCSSSH
jgi:C4-dicarboxylate-specific signal transduction histidine kinase